MQRILKLAFVVCAPLLAADQVVLTNGDTVSGTVIKKDGAVLVIKSEFMGEVTMPWSAVKSLRTDSELFVQLPSGDVVKGKVSTAADQLQVAAGPQTRTIPLAQVPALRDAGEQKNYERLLRPGLLDLWTGFLDTGLALARGNARADTFTTSATATRETRTDKVVVTFNQIYGTARANNVNSTIASAVRGGWKYNRNVTPRTFVTALNTYEHDRFQNLDLRFVIGGGFGVKAVKREGFTLDLDAGVDYNRENFLDGLHRNSAELNWGDILTYKLSKSTALTQSFRMYNNLSNTGEFRMNFDLAAVTSVRRWLAFHVTASNRYLSNPVPGHVRNDILLSTGLRFTFTR